MKQFEINVHLLQYHNNELCFEALFHHDGKASTDINLAKKPLPIFQ